MSNVNARSIALLQSLAGAGLRFATFGSAALLLRYESLRARHELRDVDVLLPPEALDDFATWVHARNGSVTAWGAPYLPGMNVVGRFYLRAELDGLQLDATFETFLDLEAALAGATVIDGVPVCADEVVWRAKLHKDAPAARAFAEAMGLVIPATAA